MLYFRFLCIITFLINITACGFSPLHGSFSDYDSTPDLAEIEIAPIANRTGQLLRNHLIDSLTPNGRPVNPKFKLSIMIEENTHRLAIKKDSFATRANFFMNASFSVIELISNKTIFNSSTKIVSSYNIINSEYATLISEKDAKSRAARELADDIKIRVAVFFTKRNKKEAISNH